MDATETFAEEPGLAYILYPKGPPYLLSDTIKSIHQFVSVYANVLTAGQSWRCEDIRGKMSAYRKAPARIVRGESESTSRLGVGTGEISSPSDRHHRVW